MFLKSVSENLWKYTYYQSRHKNYISTKQAASTGGNYQFIRLSLKAGTTLKQLFLIKDVHLGCSLCRCQEKIVFSPEIGTAW